MKQGGNISNINSDGIIYERRWYDKHEGLSLALEKLRTADKRDCDNIVAGMKKIITKKDPDFMDKVCKKFPLNPYKRRWYDKDPYLWLVVNSLRYAENKTIKEIVDLINSS